MSALDPEGGAPPLSTPEFSPSPGGSFTEAASPIDSLAASAAVTPHETIEKIIDLPEPPAIETPPPPAEIPLKSADIDPISGFSANSNVAAERTMAQANMRRAGKDFTPQPAPGAEDRPAGPKPTGETGARREADKAAIAASLETAEPLEDFPAKTGQNETLTPELQGARDEFNALDTQGKLLLFQNTASRARELGMDDPRPATDTLTAIRSGGMTPEQFATLEPKVQEAVKPGLTEKQASLYVKNIDTSGNSPLMHEAAGDHTADDGSKENPTADAPTPEGAETPPPPGGPPTAEGIPAPEGDDNSKDKGSDDEQADPLAVNSEESPVGARAADAEPVATTEAASSEPIDMTMDDVNQEIDRLLEIPLDQLTEAESEKLDKLIDLSLKSWNTQEAKTQNPSDSAVTEPSKAAAEPEPTSEIGETDEEKFRRIDTERETLDEKYNTMTTAEQNRLDDAVDAYTLDGVLPTDEELKDLVLKQIKNDKEFIDLLPPATTQKYSELQAKRKAMLPDERRKFDNATKTYETDGTLPEDEELKDLVLKNAEISREVSEVIPSLDESLEGFGNDTQEIPVEKPEETDPLTVEQPDEEMPAPTTPEPAYQWIPKKIVSDEDISDVSDQGLRDAALMNEIAGSETMSRDQLIEALREKQLAATSPEGDGAGYLNINEMGAVEIAEEQNRLIEKADRTPEEDARLHELEAAWDAKHSDVEQPADSSKEPPEDPKEYNEGFVKGLSETDLDELQKQGKMTPEERVQYKAEAVKAATEAELFKGLTEEEKTGKIEAVTNKWNTGQELTDSEKRVAKHLGLEGPEFNPKEAAVANNIQEKINKGEKLNKYEQTIKDKYKLSEQEKPLSKGAQREQRLNTLEARIRNNNATPEERREWMKLKNENKQEKTDVDRRDLLRDKLLTTGELSEEEMTELDTLNEKVKDVELTDAELNDEVEDLFTRMQDAMLSGKEISEEDMNRFRELSTQQKLRETGIEASRAKIISKEMPRLRKERQPTAVEKQTQELLQRLMNLEVQMLGVPKQVDALKDQQKQIRSKIKTKKSELGGFENDAKSQRRRTELYPLMMQLASNKGSLAHSKNLGTVLHAQYTDTMATLNSKLKLNGKFGFYKAFVQHAHAKALTAYADIKTDYDSVYNSDADEDMSSAA